MYSIADIQRLLQSKEIVIQPKYQRRRTDWPATAKTGLIDTVANNYPIQPIYLREYINSNKERRKEIIDGQQRISTIMEFLDDQFALQKNFFDEDYFGFKFSGLPFEKQQEILDYDLMFISMKGVEEADIISIFSRINSFTLPLNAQEKRNAQYSGQFKTLVYRLSAIYFSFWKEYKIFSDVSIARMGEAQFVSEIITTIIVGFKEYTPKKVDDQYKKFENEFTDVEHFYTSFNYVMTVIGAVFEDDNISAQFKKSAWFFTLFIVLYERIYHGAGKKINSSYRAINLVPVKRELNAFIDAYNNDRIDSDIKLLFQQGTATPSKRAQRHDFMYKYLFA